MCSISGKLITSKVFGADKAKLVYDKSKGRYLRATEAFKEGDVIINENAACGVLLEDKIEPKYCHYCFKIVNQERKRCYGCNYAVYCDNKCKLIAWRSHHWLECSMYDVLIKMRIESRIALRTVLNAAYSMYNDSDVNCEALHSIGESMSQSTSNNSKFGCHDSSKTKQMEYASDYWSLYCLQTHSQNQLTSTNCTNNNIDREVSRIVNILWDCFTWFDGIDKHEKTVNECEVKCSCNGETTNDVLHLLHLTFTKLSFSFYYSSDDFDILRWRKQVELACKSVSSTENKQQVSLRNIVDGIPKDCREMLRYLLVHHALQLRTNAQAIFKICSSPSPISNTNVEGTKQTRIATALFPVTSLMNHSCSPNTMVIFDGNNIKVIASRDIKEDEEIYHCYGPHCSRHSVGERQAILRDQYYFVCDCKSCIDEDGEEGSFFFQFHAFKCMFCSDPVKQDHASDGKERDNIRKCINTNCGKRQDLEKAKKVYMDSNIEYQDGCCLLEKNKIPSALSKLKASLLKKQSVLYHNHIDIGEVHDQIARCYVIQEKYHFAVQHLCKSIVIVGMLYGLRSLELARELQKLAPVYFNSGDFHSSGITARRALSILRIYYQSGPEIEEMETLLGVSGVK